MKQSIAATEAAIDSINPQVAAIARMPSKKANPAVVALTGITCVQMKVIAATTARLAGTRTINTVGRTRMRLTKMVALAEVKRRKEEIKRPSEVD